DRRVPELLAGLEDRVDERRVRVRGVGDRDRGDELHHRVRRPLARKLAVVREPVVEPALLGVPPVLLHLSEPLLGELLVLRLARDEGGVRGQRDADAREREREEPTHGPNDTLCAWRPLRRTTSSASRCRRRRSATSSTPGRCRTRSIRSPSRARRDAISGTTTGSATSTSRPSSSTSPSVTST